MNENASTTRESLAECVQAARDGVEYDGSDAETYLQEWPLDVEFHGHRSGGDDEWTIDHIDVILGIGGPTSWVEFTDTDTAVVHHVWSSDHQRAHLDSDDAEYLAAVWGVEF